MTFYYFQAWQKSSRKSLKSDQGLHQSHCNNDRLSWSILWSCKYNVIYVSTVS